MAEPTQAKYYFQLNGVKEGPVTPQTLRILAKAGSISFNTLISKEGITTSVPAGKIKGLFTDSGQTHTTESQLVPDQQFMTEKTSKTSHKLYRIDSYHGIEGIAIVTLFIIGVLLCVFLFYWIFIASGVIKVTPLT